ncbi:MAG: hypothetical protein QOF60_2140 [Actinomycetota bacterium]|nr:hypothetical protein [Actinomycetota bacterium]
MSVQTSAHADPKLVAGLRLVVGRLARRLRQQAGGEVTPSMHSAMVSVERLQPVPLGELAAVERVQPPTITKLVAKLEDLGYVVREADGRDRRIARVRLTPDGVRHLAQSRKRKDAYLAERLRRLDPGDRKLLEQALPVLERLVGDE